MSNAVSLFDARSKVFVTSAIAADLRYWMEQGIHRDGMFALSMDGDTLMATDSDGIALPVTAPPAGSVVLVTDAVDLPEAYVFTTLWRESGLEMPEIIEMDRQDPAAAALRAAAAINRALQSELEVTARDAVKLDRQIAVLRDSLEDTRSALWELRTSAHMQGRTAIESFSRAPLGETVTLGEQMEVRQMLPFAGHLIRAVSICLDAKTQHSESMGTLHATLVAVEDGSIWGDWEIAKTDWGERDHVWVTLAVETEVPRRHRFLELVVSWRGLAEGKPVLRLASAGGDKRAEVKGPTDGSTADRMLALRVLTGMPYDAERRNDTILFNNELVPDEDGTFRVVIPRHAFAGVTKLSKAEPEIEWCRTDGNGIFVHPAKNGPSVAGLNLHMLPEIAGISTRLELAHQRAFPTEFGIVCSAFELEPEAIVAAADPDADPGDGIVARAPWTGLNGGSSRPLQVRFDTPISHVNVYFTTRTTGDRVDFAHAWFRDVMALR
ncbi:MAG: DUF6212 domain-containing protein [Pseudomonadota bacterium]